MGVLAKKVIVYKTDIMSILGPRSWSHLPRPLDSEADPAVRDPACPSRHDDPGPKRRWQDPVYPHPDEGYDRVRGAPQGDEDEPQGYHGPSDVWAAGRCHQ